MYDILVVEDEKSIRELVVYNLELDGYSVSFAETGKTALEMTKKSDYRLVILDVMLPEMDGFEICRQMRAAGNKVPILFLSARGSGEDRIKGLELGADDYLSKPFELKELLLRVQRRILPKPDLNTLQFGENMVFLNSFEAKNFKQETVQLSKKEIALLTFMYQHKNEVVSRDTILDEIWGVDAYPISRTVDNYFMNFRKYFERDSRNPEFFIGIRGVGYKFQAD